MSVEDLKRIGNEAFKSEDFDKAIDYFTQALNLDSTNAVLYSNRSGAYVSKGEYEKALNDAIKAVEFNQSWPKAYSRKSVAEYHLGKIPEAIATCKEGLKLDPTNETLKQILEKAQALDPVEQQTEMMLNMLLCNPKFQNYAKEDPDYLTKLKTILKETFKDPKSLQLALALNFDPRITEALKIVFQLPTSPEEEKQEQQRQAAPKTKEDKVETKGDDGVRSPEQKEADEWKDKGNNLYSKRQFEEALKAYDKAIELYPSNITYKLNKAAVYLEMQEYDKCLAECKACIDDSLEGKTHYVQVAKVYARMAVCYRRMKDYDKAIEMFEKALLENNIRQYRAALKEIKDLKEKKDREDYVNPEIAETLRLEGNECFKQGLFPKAKGIYDEAILRNPVDPRLYANRAAVLMKLLELPMALTDVDKSLELDPTNPKVWARKGVIHMMMKEYNKAINAFQKGLNIDSMHVDCQRGLEDVMRKIQETTTSDKVDEEQIKHAMSDPEIQALLTDPQFTIVLRGISEDPSKLKDALKNPRIAVGIQKLMAAGILKMSAA